MQVWHILRTQCTETYKHRRYINPPGPLLPVRSTGDHGASCIINIPACLTLDAPAAYAITLAKYAVLKFYNRLNFTLSYEPIRPIGVRAKPLRRRCKRWPVEKDIYALTIHIFLNRIKWNKICVVDFPRRRCQCCSPPSIASARSAFRLLCPKHVSLGVRGKGFGYKSLTVYALATLCGRFWYRWGCENKNIICAVLVKFNDLTTAVEWL